MSILTIESPPKAVSVNCTDDELIVSLTDGRVVSVPIVWFPRLQSATQYQRADYELMGEGVGIHWSEIDEDISVAGLLAGTPSIEVTRALTSR